MVADPAAPWAETVFHTADQLAALPEDGWRYELVHGRLVRMSPAGFRHGRLAARLSRDVGNFVEGRGLGEVLAAETGFIISPPGQPDTVLAPDVAFLATSRLPAPGSAGWAGFPRLAPDLVIEVASPSQGRDELAAKARIWLDAGARMVWLILPDHDVVEVYEAGRGESPLVLHRSDELSGGEVLPGYRYSLDSLWD